MPPPLAGKVALVTGAGSGIGKASATAFAGMGARVVVSDVDSGTGQETVGAIRESGGTAIFVRCDVSDEDEVRVLMARAVEAYGRIDCAHNNAGVEQARSRTADFPEEVWDRLIDVNLKGVWLCMKHEIPRMLEQGGGAIVNTASIAGLVGFPMHPAYVASKHGVVGLTKAAALEYARTGIRVNAVCPGIIKTPLVAETIRENPGLEERYAEGEPVGRLGTPEEVAEAVVWLCSGAATFVTGHAMAVDGGWVAQ